MKHILGINKIPDLRRVFHKPQKGLSNDWLLLSRDMLSLSRLLAIQAIDYYNQTYHRDSNMGVQNYCSKRFDKMSELLSDSSKAIKQRLTTDFRMSVEERNKVKFCIEILEIHRKDGLNGLKSCYLWSPLADRINIVKSDIKARFVPHHSLELMPPRSAYIPGF